MIPIDGDEGAFNAKRSQPFVIAGKKPDFSTPGKLKTALSISFALISPTN